MRLARTGHTVLLTQDTLQERELVLRRLKFLRYLDPRGRDAVLAALVREMEWVEPGEPIRRCRDPRDDKFLEAAVWGRADCILNGDGDLLVLEPFGAISIRTPAQFLMN